MRFIPPSLTVSLDITFPGRFEAVYDTWDYHRESVECLYIVKVIV